MLISLPAARQAYYSGNGGHQERWIKQPGTRDEALHPNHVKNALFLQSGTGNERVTGAEGDFIIYLWDYDSGDNFGFYRLNILLTRGRGKPPIVD